MTGTQVVYGKRQPLPRPGYSIFNQCSIYVQSMFNDMLCELPFVRVVVAQAVMFIAMLCELLFVRVLNVAI